MCIARSTGRAVIHLWSRKLANQLDVSDIVDWCRENEHLRKSCHDAERRVAWLENQIRTVLPRSGINILENGTKSMAPDTFHVELQNDSLDYPGWIKPSNDTLIDQYELLNTVLSFDRRDAVGSSAQPSSGPIAQSSRVQIRDLDFAYDVHAPPSPLGTHLSPQQLGLPPFEETMDVVRRFTSDLKMTHQLVSHDQIEKDARVVYNDASPSGAELAVSRFRIFALLCLSGPGFLGYSRGDDWPTASFREKAMKELPIVTRIEDLVRRFV